MLLTRKSPHRLVSGVAALVTASAVVLLPWIVYLAATLPPSISVRHWPLAWIGLDSFMAVGLAVTGVLAFRRDRRVALAAASTATVLFLDGWFDVCTAPPGRSFAFALTDLCIETGEAVACLMLGWAIWRDERDERDERDDAQRG
jgi:hypothetical protein